MGYTDGVFHLEAFEHDGRLAFSDAVRGGVFLPLGHGDIDLHSVLAAVQNACYDGWYVFEQDAQLAAPGRRGSAPGAPAHCGRALDQSRSPALADITGPRRVRTAVMISSGSIPWR